MLELQRILRPSCHVQYRLSSASRLPSRVGGGCTLTAYAQQTGRKRRRGNVLDNAEPGAPADDVAYISRHTPAPPVQRAQGESSSTAEGRYRYVKPDLSERIGTGAAGGAWQTTPGQQQQQSSPVDAWQDDAADWRQQQGPADPWQEAAADRQDQQPRQQSQQRQHGTAADSTTPEPWWRLGGFGRAPADQPSDWEAPDRRTEDWGWPGDVDAQRDAASDSRSSSSGPTGAFEEAENPAGEGLAGAEPDITLLSPTEVEQVLPLLPQGPQAQALGTRGAPDRLLQQWGIALLVTLFSAKFTPLAAGAASSPLWWPWFQALRRNQGIRSRSRCVGLWRAQVLEAQLTQRGRPRFSTSPRGTMADAQPLTRLLVGDQAGARAEVCVPYDRRHDNIQVGEAAELLLLSRSEEFTSFQALREAYLPASGIWLATYPFISRDAFMALSLDIERERAAEQAAGPPADLSG